MEEKPTTNPSDETPKEVNPVAESAAYGCCFAFILSAVIMVAVFYGIYKLILYLL